MSRRFRARVIGVAIVAACGFTATDPGGNGTPIDAPEGTPDDSKIIDAPPDAFIQPECLAEGHSCVGSGERHRYCSGTGATPMDEVCAWRCEATGQAHCRKLQPSGGVLLPVDLEPTAGLGDKTISPLTTVEFNTQTGSIVMDSFVQVRAGGVGTSNGIEFSVRSGVGVWRFNKLAVTGYPIQFSGTNAAALVAITELQITGKIDLQGDCQGRTAGPGGGSGGGKGSAGSGSGSGRGGDNDDGDCEAGGGGGNAAAGGSGGGGTSGGSAFGGAAIPVLKGGGGGGGGGGGSGADGGGGGGAIQIAANFKVRINGTVTNLGGIHAGGCGGKTAADCGGGAGAGGTILIEAAVIEVLNATLAVNGGGGGGGRSGTSGQRASFSTQRAAGGNGGNGGMGPDGGDGGDGGDDGGFVGLPGQGQSRPGGGGGAVGRIRFNTLTGTIMKQGVIFSPALSTSPSNATPVTEGSASLQ